VRGDGRRSTGVIHQDYRFSLPSGQVVQVLVLTSISEMVLSGPDRAKNQRRAGQGVRAGFGPPNATPPGTPHARESQ
jgi:hypothetical protein